MGKYLTLIFASAFLTLEAPDFGANKSYAHSVEEMYSVVVYLHSEKETSRKIDIGGESYEVWVKRPNELQPRPYFEHRTGTGFFVVRGEAYYLVTAQHVANETSSTSQITIKSENDKPYCFSLGELWNQTGPLTWVFHQEADIAVLPLKPSAALIKKLEGHFLPFRDLNGEEKAPLRERPLTVIGFPLGLGIRDRFSPISQETKPSSGLLRLARFDNRKMATFYILDKPSVGGFSGAPVFMLPSSYFFEDRMVVSKGVSCVGVVHGTLFDNTGGKFAAVVPSSFVIETIHQAEGPTHPADQGLVSQHRPEPPSTHPQILPSYLP